MRPRDATFPATFVCVLLGHVGVIAAILLLSPPECQRSLEAEAIPHGDYLAAHETPDEGDSSQTYLLNLALEESMKRTEPTPSLSDRVRDDPASRLVLPQTPDSSIHKIPITAPRPVNPASPKREKAKKPLASTAPPSRKSAPKKEVKKIKPRKTSPPPRVQRKPEPKKPAPKKVTPKKPLTTKKNPITPSKPSKKAVKSSSKPVKAKVASTPEGATSKPTVTPAKAVIKPKIVGRAQEAGESHSGLSRSDSSGLSGSSTKKTPAVVDMGSYRTAVEKKLKARWRLPKGIQADHQPEVYIRISQSGTISYARLNRSSGKSALDRSAIDTAKIGSSLLPLPKGYTKEFYELTIKFQID